MAKCPKCAAIYTNEAKPCPNCGYSPASDFHGIYRVSAFGKQTPIYCPKCKSQNCQWFIDSKTIPEMSKTKTRYTVNLNPLHPFTLVNKKEKKKVIAPATTIQTKKILCNNCGHIFL